MNEKEHSDSELYYHDDEQEPEEDNANRHFDEAEASGDQEFQQMQDLFS